MAKMASVPPGARQSAASENRVGHVDAFHRIPESVENLGEERIRRVALDDGDLDSALIVAQDAFDSLRRRGRC